MIKAVLFDLDDTLYPEIEYVESGFREASFFLEKKYDLSSMLLYWQMMVELAASGRGKIFDTVLSQFGIYSKELVQVLVYLYRTHKPNIVLPNDSINLLLELKQMGILTGIITDGKSCMQWNKINALELQKLTNVIICTDDLGAGYQKPSPSLFLFASGLLNTKPSETVYVGNDITKDFFGANIIGMKTVWITKSSTPDLDRTYLPDYKIEKLEQVWDCLALQI